MMSTRWGCCDCTPSEAEGLHPERSRGMHPERSRGQYPERSRVLHPERSRGVAPRAEPRAPRAKPRSVPRAKPRGTYTHKILVSTSLDEQFERSRALHPERSRGVHIHIRFSSRLRSTNSLSMRGIYCKKNAPHFCEALSHFVINLS
jgi:hypothetical protein